MRALLNMPFNSSNDILHLLLITQDQNDAEELVSLLRNSGQAVRAHMVSSQDDFNQQIQLNSWDLILAEPHAHGIDPTEIFSQINLLDIDLPVILLTGDIDNATVESYVSLGTCEIVPKGENGLLSVLVDKALRQLFSRRSLRITNVKLREYETQFNSLLDSSKHAIAFIREGVHVYANSSYLEFFGYEYAHDLNGISIKDLVVASDQEKLNSSIEDFMDSGESIELNLKGLRTDDNELSITMSLSSASYANEPCTQVIIRHQLDSSDGRVLLHGTSTHDPATGLYNKPYFMVSLGSAVDRAIMKGDTGATLYVCIDRFSNIKSKVGINHSDLVVCAVANYLKSITTEDDTLARVGESSFALIKANINSKQALDIAEKSRHTLKRLLITAGTQKVNITVTIGIALINNNYSDPIEVLEHAYQASESAKSYEELERGNRVSIYATEEGPTENNDDYIEEQAISAFKNNSFKLLYQPLLGFSGDDQEHYETLLRIPQNNSVDISADKFFNGFVISEDLKRKIDRWIILHSTKRLSEHLTGKTRGRLMINLCAASLMDDTLANWIGIALKAAKIARSSVIFQINEKDATRFLNKAKAFTADLKSKGYSCSLSNFGCSLKSLEILDTLSLEFVKFDPSFSKDLKETKNLELLKHLIDEVHQRELKTIVPSIESAASVSSLWPLGVNFVQGYYVQPPEEQMNYAFSDNNK